MPLAARPALARLAALLLAVPAGRGDRAAAGADRGDREGLGALPRPRRHAADPRQLRGLARPERRRARRLRHRSRRPRMRRRLGRLLRRRAAARSAPGCPSPTAATTASTSGRCAARDRGRRGRRAAGGGRPLRRAQLRATAATRRLHPHLALRQQRAREPAGRRAAPPPRRSRRRSPPPIPRGAGLAGWTLRRVPGASPVALGAGPATSPRSPPSASRASLPRAHLPRPAGEPRASTLDFAFSQGALDVTAGFESTAGGAYVVALADCPLAAAARRPRQRGRGQGRRRSPGHPFARRLDQGAPRRARGLPRVLKVRGRA